MKFFILRWKGIAAALTVLGLCFGILRFTTPLFFLASIFLWGAVVVLLFRDRIRDHTIWWSLGLLLMSYIATIMLMSLTEWVFVTRSIIVLAAVILGVFVSIVDIMETQDVPIYTKKAFRRMLVMGWVFVCGSLFISTYAVSVFFSSISVEVFFLAVGIYTSLISFAIWRMYYPISIKRFSLWLLIMAVISMEIFWAIHLLPFGYAALGFLATWIWYIVLLLVRFHMSVEGIRWKKQRMFLIENGILFVCILFIIRWI